MSKVGKRRWGALERYKRASGGQGAWERPVVGMFKVAAWKVGLGKQPRALALGLPWHTKHAQRSLLCPARCQALLVVSGEAVHTNRRTYA